MSDAGYTFLVSSERAQRMLETMDSRLREAAARAAKDEREAIIKLIASGNPRDNGAATVLYSTPGQKEFDDGWLVAVETKLHAIRARDKTGHQEPTQS